MTTETVHPLWRAQRDLRRGRYDACAELCTAMLAKNRLDTAAWLLKCRALTRKAWIDDLDVEEPTLGDALLDAHAGAKNPRPGTSFNRPYTTQKDDPSGRLATRRGASRTGRPTSGFVRPSTTTRPLTSRRLGTASIRPGTASVVRLATASTRAQMADDVFLRVAATDVQELAKNPACTRVLCDFYLYHEHDARSALDLCNAVEARRHDWWWTGRLGKCLYQLGMFQEAEANFRQSLQLQHMVATSLELAKIFLRRDQPNGALAVFDDCLAAVPDDVDALLGKARVYSALQDDVAADAFAAVLKFDGFNVEARASLAAHRFDQGSPHQALQSYRRILQMGVSNAEVWNNLGLCCLLTSQYDVSLHCFAQALRLSSDGDAPDVWYNISHVALEVGEVEMAEQALSMATWLDPTHAEALNNLAVLHMERGHITTARQYLSKSHRAKSEIFEPWFNAAVDALERDDFQTGHATLTKALEICPGHRESQRFLDSILLEFAYQ